MTLIDAFLDFAIAKVNTKFNQENDFNERVKKFNEHECLERNRPESCHSYADAVLMKDGLPYKAAKIFQKNCIRNKFSRSCFNYGNMRVGTYTIMIDPTRKLRYPEINPSVALDYFRLGCNGGCHGACFNAAVILTMGINGTKESNISPEYYSTPWTKKPPKTITVDNGMSFVLPADFVADIRNVKNYSFEVANEILELFQKGCNNEYHDSCFNAAKLSAYGYSAKRPQMTPDYETAYDYCRKGCQFGNQNCCFLGHDLIVSGRLKSRTLDEAKELILQADQSDKQSTLSRRQ